MNMKNLNFKYFLGILTVCIMQGVCSSCSNDDNGTASVQASLAGIWQGDYAQWVIQPDGTYEVINEVLGVIGHSGNFIEWEGSGKIIYNGNSSPLIIETGEGSLSIADYKIERDKITLKMKGETVTLKRESAFKNEAPEQLKNCRFNCKIDKFYNLYFDEIGKVFLAKGCERDDLIGPITYNYTKTSQNTATLTCSFARKYMIKSKYKEYEIHKYTFTYDLEFRGTKTENGIGEMYLGRTLAEEKIEYESYDNNGNLIGEDSTTDVGYEYFAIENE
ncbi:hypothetical protein I6E23_00845 [Prevotella brevis]|nr:hypothetical protein [Xylanibacter brevis]